MTGPNRARLLIVIAAFLSFVFSVYLWFMVDKTKGQFVGLWVPSILSFGTLMLNRGGSRNE